MIGLLNEFSFDKPNLFPCENPGSNYGFMTLIGLYVGVSLDEIQTDDLGNLNPSVMHRLT